MFPMITPEDIKNRALKIWNLGTVLRAHCTGEDIFPVEVPFGKKGGMDIFQNYAGYNEAIKKLAAGSKESKGSGYLVIYREVNHRQLGMQKLPEKIIIETLDDFLLFTGRKINFQHFKELHLITATVYPEALIFVKEKPLHVLQHYESWQKILNICLFFRDNPCSGLYIRQIVLPGTDTKFIEKNKKIISEIMASIYPEKFNGTSCVQNAFEERFGLLYDSPLIRFRILDSDLKINMMADISIPLNEFLNLDIDVKTVFITENKINGLSFPPFKKGLVLFGMGYGINSLEKVNWLKNKKIYYWGDIDTHGFNILNSIRKILPQTKSILMDEETFLLHSNAWVTEPQPKRITAELERLTEKEIFLYHRLVNNYHGTSLRLEQELIDFSLLQDYLKNI